MFDSGSHGRRLRACRCESSFGFPKLTDSQLTCRLRKARKTIWYCLSARSTLRLGRRTFSHSLKKCWIMRSTSSKVRLRASANEISNSVTLHLFFTRAKRVIELTKSYLVFSLFEYRLGQLSSPRPPWVDPLTASQRFHAKIESFLPTEWVIAALISRHKSETKSHFATRIGHSDGAKTSSSLS